ncbi:hypothetical protein PYCCODRAFT_1200868 [Trametes coccinea BRFM310]|uniref:Uncharacterized protein n=1 Tax=Trametes coccinea (strain BRFM310) TaxID=1353009 RepID=A0A1Y2IAS0_TRAC3|nr:hypothetical protein PYCCODRAFT_1200868 [Trametes coccinea BRFM310]
MGTLCSILLRRCVRVPTSRLHSAQYPAGQSGRVVRHVRGSTLLRAGSRHQIKPRLGRLHNVGHGGAGRLGAEPPLQSQCWSRRISVQPGRIHWTPTFAEMSDIPRVAHTLRRTRGRAVTKVAKAGSPPAGALFWGARPSVIKSHWTCRHRSHNTSLDRIASVTARSGARCRRLDE